MVTYSADKVLECHQRLLPEGLLGAHIRKGRLHMVIYDINLAILYGKLHNVVIK